jgi:hypothetical protein
MIAYVQGEYLHHDTSSKLSSLATLQHALQVLLRYFSGCEKEHFA